MKKISSIVLWVLIAISVVVFLLFAFGGTIDAAAEYPEPVYTQIFMYLMYAFVGIAIVITIAAQLTQFVQKLISYPKQALKSVLGIALLAILFLVTYVMASGEPVAIIGMELDLSTTWLKLVDSQLYMSYVLCGIGFLLMIFGGFAKKL